MTLLHPNEETHISMIATIVDEVVAQDKLIGTDSETLKTKNFFPRDLRDYSYSPWKISKFNISQAQILAITSTTPVILLPALGDGKWYEFNPIYSNTFKNVVTNPANPFVCGATDEINIGWWSPSTGFFWNATAPFEKMGQSEITNPTTQVVKLSPDNQATTTNVASVYDESSATGGSASAAALGRYVGSGAPGWITGEGYWEVELMYRENEKIF